MIWRDPAWSAGGALEQLGGSQFEVALFGEVRGSSWQREGRTGGGGGVAGSFEEVGADGFEAVGVGHAVLGVEGAEQGRRSD
jgi:hypothetical protein